MQGKPTFKEILTFLRWPNLLLIVVFFFVIDVAFFDWMVDTLDASRALDRADKSLLLLDLLIVTSIGYMINDLRDLETDRINRPQRLLIRFPDLHRRVRAYVLILVVFGFGITLYLGWSHNKLPWVMLYPISLLLLYGYAQVGRRFGLVGNILVSLLIAAIPGILILAEWSLITQFFTAFDELVSSLIRISISFVALMFVANLSREIIKDLEDLEGDDHGQKRTLPMQIGIKSSKGVSLALLAMVIAFQSAIVLECPTILIKAAALCVLISVLVLTFRLFRSSSARDFNQVSQGLKILMLIGVMELLFIPSGLS